MSGPNPKCVTCDLDAKFQIRHSPEVESVSMCLFHAIKEMVTTETVCELSDLSYRYVPSGTEDEDRIPFSESIFQTGKTVPQICLEEIRKEARKIQLPKRLSKETSRCFPYFTIDFRERLDRSAEDLLKNWAALENYLDVCKCVEHIGELNDESIAREFTWEVYKMTEELSCISRMIGDGQLYNYESRVTSGLEICIGTIDLLRSRFLTTEEVASCVNSLGGYHYFSEIHDFDQTLNLLTLLKCYSVLLETRDLKLQYQFLQSNNSDEDDFYDEEIYKFVSVYLKPVQQYVQLCPSHPDFKVVLGMLANYFKSPNFIEWAEELQTDLPLNDFHSLFLDSQSASDSTAPELIHASREHFQENSVMNRILVAKWLSLLPNDQSESLLEDLFGSLNFTSLYPLLVADKVMKVGLCTHSPGVQLRLLRKAADLMESEPKFKTKRAECYAIQAELLVKNEGNQYEIERLMLCARDGLKSLDLRARCMLSYYVAVRRFADLEHFLIFSKRIFQSELTLPILGTLTTLYEQRAIDHFTSRCSRTR